MQGPALYFILEASAISVGDFWRMAPSGKSVLPWLSCRDHGNWSATRCPCVQGVCVQGLGKRLSAASTMIKGVCYRT